jgi:hypothetical protein
VKQLKIRLEKYFPKGGDMLEVSDASSIRAARGLLKAAEIKRDEVRAQNESSPIISDEINKDFRFKAGVVSALNWILELPDQAKFYINNLPDKGDV